MCKGEKNGPFYNCAGIIGHLYATTINKETATHTLQHIQKLTKMDHRLWCRA